MAPRPDFRFWPALFPPGHVSGCQSLSNLSMGPTKMFPDPWNAKFNFSYVPRRGWWKKQRGDLSCLASWNPATLLLAGVPGPSPSQAGTGVLRGRGEGAFSGCCYPAGRVLAVCENAAEQRLEKGKDQGSTKLMNSQWLHTVGTGRLGAFPGAGTATPRELSFPSLPTSQPRTGPSSLPPHPCIPPRTSRTWV